MRPDPVPVCACMYCGYLATAAVAVAVTPPPALRRPALGNQSPCFPHCAAVSFLPLPAAPHRGVFRGADVTVHVTAPSSPGLSMYRAVPGVPGYPVQHEWVRPLQSTQVPERHGYPRSAPLASTYGIKNGEPPSGCTRYICSTLSENQQRARPRGLLASPTLSAAGSSDACVRIQQPAARSVSQSVSQAVSKSARRSAESKRELQRALSSEAQPSARQTGFNAARPPVATHTSG